MSEIFPTSTDDCSLIACFENVRQRGRQYSCRIELMWGAFVCLDALCDVSPTARIHLQRRSHVNFAVLDGIEVPIDVTSRSTITDALRVFYRIGREEGLRQLEEWWFWDSISLR